MYHLTNACHIIDWNDKLQAYLDLHIDIFLKTEFLRMGRENWEGDMILNWLEAKKICPEKILNVDPPNSDKFQHPFYDTFENE